MVEVMNQLGVHASSHGNHDYDFGVETLQQRTEACSAWKPLVRFVGGFPCHVCVGQTFRGFSPMFWIEKLANR
jgi:hypothetical protein